MESSPPTEEELMLIRKNLIQQIEEAQTLFDTERNVHELLTSKAALKCIDQLIRRMRKEKKSDVA